MQPTTYYPMTTSQSILLYADRFCLIRSWLNIAAVLDIQQPIDERQMLQAITLTMMRTPSASIRLHKKDKKTLEQYFSDELPKGIELVDMSHLSDEEREKELTKWAQTPFPKKALDTQLYNIKLLRRNDGLCSIYVCVYHMVFDSYTLMTTIRYITDVYEALINNSPLPKEFSSPMPMYEAEYAYYQSERYQKDQEFWKNYFQKDDEPFYTSLHGKDGKYCVKGKRYGRKNILLQNKTLHENLRIPAELVQKVQALASEWRVSPQSFYQTAQHAYLSVICDTDDVCITNAVARRATRIQKRGGGTMVNPVFVRSKIDRKNTSFHDACVTVYRDITDAYRHADMMFGEVAGIILQTYGVQQGNGYDGTTLCYQPYFNLDSENLQFSFHRLNNGGGSCVLYITIMPCDNSGDLWCNYEYITPYYNAEQIKKYHAYLLKFLDNVTSTPEENLESLVEKSM